MITSNSKNPLRNITLMTAINCLLGFVSCAYSNHVKHIGIMCSGLLGAVIIVVITCAVTSAFLRMTAIYSDKKIHLIYYLIHHASLAAYGIAVIYGLFAALFSYHDQMPLPEFIGVLAILGYAIQYTITGGSAGKIIGKQPLIGHCILGGVIGTAIPSIAVLIA